MEAVARQQISQNINIEVQVELVKVRATKTIVISDSTLEESPTVIAQGEVFMVNLIPMDGMKGLGAHYRGESFFVEDHEWSVLSN